jgi:hypothetical protein
VNSPALHILRGALRPSVDGSRRMHNVFADGGPASAMEIARSLGDLSHNVYTSTAYRLHGRSWSARRATDRSDARSEARITAVRPIACEARVSPRNVSRPARPMGWLDGRRTWWAHFEFTRINIEPIILRKKIEDAREVSAIVGFRATAALWP